MRASLLMAARWSFVGFCLLTAAFCVLALIPFTWVQVIQFNLLPGQRFFLEHQHHLYWLAAAAGAASLAADLRTPERRRPALLACAGLAVMGLVLLGHPVLARLREDDPGLWAWAASFLALPLGLFTVDLWSTRGRVAWSLAPASDDRRLLVGALGAAGFVWALHGAETFARAAPAGGVGRFAIAAGYSLILHLLPFLGWLVLLQVIRGLARVIAGPTGRAAVLELGGLVVAAIGAGAAVIDRVALAAASFTGAPALAVSVAFAAVAVLTTVGLGLRLHARGLAIEGGFAVLLAPLALSRAAGRGRRPLALAVLALAGAGVVLSASRMDWNYLVQTLVVLVIWVVAFATLYLSAPATGARPGTGALVALATLSVVAYQGAARGRAALAPRLAAAGLDSTLLLDQYAEREPSFRLLTQALGGGARPGDDGQFQAFLQRNSNISHTVKIAPIPVVFGAGARPGGRRPDIFVFVIDSLRQDYLSAYNPAVTFTPALDRLAKDAVVFRNAFTFYGGTGLSEPAIWVGGRMPHQQYITPFRPMNALQSLLESEHYHALVSMDVILRTVVTPWPGLEELDRGVPNKDYDLCRTLDEIQHRVEASPRDQPLFVYTQPQNLHISTITRAGGRSLDGESYGAFHAPYASRLRHIDACLGTFLARLKALGRYDDSIIVVTADHGDSLGEGGRWGHAYTLFPEILRVPLIVHLPAALRAGRAVDPAMTAFPQDLTPTLHDLLGRPPSLPGDVFGRSLLPPAAAGPARERPFYLVAASYGPVWGVLGARGAWLYVTDAVNYQDYYFDLRSDPAGARNAVTPELRAQNIARIREGLTRIHATWHIPPL